MRELIEDLSPLESDGLRELGQAHEGLRALPAANATGLRRARHLWLVR